LPRRIAPGKDETSAIDDRSLQRVRGSNSEIMILRFVEQWEYHEIAAAQSVPIGTVQWRVLNSKKKLTARLTRGNVAEKIAA
jgi:DNA-directed RNA polymerase specialized sigma24 family protein